MSSTKSITKDLSKTVKAPESATKTVTTKSVTSKPVVATKPTATMATKKETSATTKASRIPTAKVVTKSQKNVLEDSTNIKSSVDERPIEAATPSKRVSSPNRKRPFNLQETFTACTKKTKQPIEN